MVKTLLKTVLAGLACYSGALRLLALMRRTVFGSDGCIILTYHRVIPRNAGCHTAETWELFPSLPSIIVSPETFQEQIRFLSTRYVVLSLDELVSRLEQGKEIPPKSVVITFDDGWRDNFVYALPVLKKYGVPATIFLATGLVGTRRLFWPEKVIWLLSRRSRSRTDASAIPADLASGSLRRLLDRISMHPDGSTNEALTELIEAMKIMLPHQRGAFMEHLAGGKRSDPEPAGDTRTILSWNEVIAMQEAGIRFGSHGINHEILTRIDHRARATELQDSKRTIEERIGQPTLAFAYPNGDFDAQVREEAAAAGYRCALGTRPGQTRSGSDLFALKRINIHDGSSRGPRGGFSPARFAWHIEGRFD